METLIPLTSSTIVLDRLSFSIQDEASECHTQML